MGANNPRGIAIFDPRCMVDRIFTEDHLTLLHTKYESSRPCGFGEDFLCFSHDAPGRGLYDPRGTVGRIYTRTPRRSISHLHRAKSIECEIYVKGTRTMCVLEEYVNDNYYARFHTCSYQ